MNPLSAIALAGTALQLADYAGNVLVGLYRYLVDVKEAGRKAVELREEIGSSTRYPLRSA